MTEAANIMTSDLLITSTPMDRRLRLGTHASSCRGAWRRDVVVLRLVLDL